MANLYLFTDYPDVVNTTQLQEMLGVSKATVYRLLKDKIIQSVKIGHQIRIPKISVISYCTNEKFW